MIALERFLPLLVDGDTGASLADLAPDAEIHDVLHGRVLPPVVPSFLIARHMWLRDRGARVEPVGTITVPGRSVVESVLHLTVDGRAVPLPVAIVADEQPDGTLRQVRVYHSTWPLTGRHDVRRPLLPPDERLVLAEPVASYQRALAAGDVEAVLARFAPEATVREPAGGAHRHDGPEGRREFYAQILARGGIPLDHASVTDDGRACALEYTVVRWGRTPLPPQPGVAVYERASPSLLAAARIYDDVAPPALR
jgi:hypothetical protein